MRFPLSVCLITVLLMPGCSREAAAPHAGLLVSTEWLAPRLDDTDLVVLHAARDRAHYDAGHIPGARYLPWDELAVARAGVQNELPPADDLRRLFERLGVSNETHVVVYGDSLGLSAARAYFTLDYLGHGERTSLLDGGLEKWRAEQRPLSTEPPQPRAGRFVPRLQPDRVVFLDQVRDLSWAAATLPDPGVALIDSRPVEDYAGTKPSGTTARTGHIPGASNVYWHQHFVSPENPALRPAEELRALYESAGASPDGTAIAYCGSGVQASHTYFVLKYLGYDVRLYDGSFSEWSRAVDTPVARADSP